MTFLMILSTLITYLSTLALYYFYNKHFFAFTAHTLNCPVPKRLTYLITWACNYLIFIVLSNSEFPLVMNWTFIGLLYILEANLVLRASLRDGSLVALIGTTVGLASTVIMRSICAMVLSIPLSMVGTDNETFKALPVALGFLLAAIGMRLIDTPSIHRVLGTILTERRVTRFLLLALILCYMYLCSNLLLYYNDLNTIIIKLWSLKSAVFVVVGATMSLLFGYRLASVLSQAKRRETLAQEIERDEEAKAHLLKLAEHDALTGCFNRQYTEQKITEFLEEHKPCRVVFVDVDNLKTVNDRYGHEAGDAYIATVADALDQTRASSTDIVARYGGDEFLIVLPHTIAETDLAERMSVVTKTLKDAVRDKGLPYTPSVSWGSAIAEDTDDAQSLITRADEAMYQHKRHKKELFAS